MRYLPKTAIAPATVVTATDNRPPNWTLAPTGMYTSNTVMAQAEEARMRNDINRARELYQIVANSAADESQKTYAKTWLAKLPASVPGTTTSLSPGNAPAAPTAAPAGNLVTLQQAAWSTWGRLRDTKVMSDNGQPLYALEDAQGKTITYVTTIQGKSLQMFIGRMVAVYGPTMYRPDSAVRMPGGQFVTMLVDLHDGEEAERVAAKIAKALSGPVNTGVEVLHPRCRVGVAVYPTHGDQLLPLLEAANRALDGARAAGGGTVAKAS